MGSLSALFFLFIFPSVFFQVAVYLLFSLYILSTSVMKDAHTKEYGCLISGCLLIDMCIMFSKYATSCISSGKRETSLAKSLLNLLKYVYPLLK